MKIGFITGVLDLPHESHFRLLKSAKERCDYLIVGLTTDERCIMEKRKPIMSFEQRRAILDNCKWVDSVVKNTGQTKKQMYERLNFDILFTTEEYIDKPEFINFKMAYPDVPVIAFPTQGGPRTTHHIQSIEEDIVNSIEILCVGVAGPIYLLNRRDTKKIIKPINVGTLEYVRNLKQFNTSNVYNLPIPLPRNWKKVGYPHKHPNITGVNTLRELAILPFIKDHLWNPIENYKLMHESILQSPKQLPDTEIYCNMDRMYPAAIYWLYQKKCKHTLHNWILQNIHKNNIDQLVDLCNKVYTIIKEDLIPKGIIHGDLHSANIVLDEQNNLFLIDWGWCIHRSFDMKLNEKNYFEECLSENFDWKHFSDSLEYDYGKLEWWKEFSQNLSQN